MSEYTQFYSSYFSAFPEAGSSGEVAVNCLFHDDSDPSMSVNIKTGLWRCFGACDEGGDAYSFYQKIHDVSFKEAKKAVDTIVIGKNIDGIVSPIPQELIHRWHQSLLNSPQVINYLLTERGLTLETIVGFQLGWDGSRITIPIYDERNLCMNVRKYKPHAKGKDKMINHKTGYGKARLYPISNLQNEAIILFEGEWDCQLACQLGLAAMTTTGGAGTWLSDWSILFKNKTLYICYDADDVGKKGAAEVAKSVHPHAKNVFLIDLPLPGTKIDKDLTDYIVKHGYTVDNFKEVIGKARQYIPINKAAAPGEAVEDEDIFDVTLTEARLAKNRNKKLRMKALVVGKDLAPYTIPRRIRFTCTAMSPENNSCSTCTISHNGGEAILDLPPNAGLLNLIRCTEGQQQDFLRKWVGIPKKCVAAFTQEIIVPQNIEEILLAPEISYESSRSTDQYTLQKAYFVAGENGSIRSNQSYKIEGIMAPDPWQQYVTFVLNSAMPIQDSISGFVITETVRERLKMFRPKEGQSIKDKFEEIHNQFAHNITHIYGRNDLLTALDLVYHSVLSFNFQGVNITRGWLELLVIGDTRTGKSETTERIMQFYQLGELVFGENTTFAGLVGGMQQTQSRWFITWGKIPLNDRRLAIIDEASGLSEDDISRMSGIRSSGIAEITKIQTERAFARTRLIWLSNPRAGRALRTYSYGVEAIPELIGKVEDIARFDFALSCASEEIPTELINQLSNTRGSVELTYTGDLCKALILWAWSRKPADIVFEEDAEGEILSHAIQMGKQYSTRIPLVEPANQRIKLARLSIAIAVRIYSTDDAGQKVIVKAEHVKFARQYLEEIYSKPSLAYTAYSRQEKDAEKLASKHIDEVSNFCELFPDVADIFMRQNFIKGQELEEQLAVDRNTAREHLHLLSRTRMIERTTYGYRKSPTFIAILRRRQSNSV